MNPLCEAPPCTPTRTTGLGILSKDRKSMCASPGRHPELLDFRKTGFACLGTCPGLRGSTGYEPSWGGWGAVTEGDPHPFPAIPRLPRVGLGRCCDAEGGPPSPAPPDHSWTQRWSREQVELPLQRLVVQEVERKGTARAPQAASHLQGQVGVSGVPR